MNAVSLVDVRKTFGSIMALDGMSLEIPDGSFGTLLGPSGSGKSTALRMIAGLDHPDSGEIRIAGHDVTGLPPHRRPSAMVFQRYALFPHMSVRQNVSFGLRQQGVNESEISKRVATVLDLVSMSDRAESRPHELSGGQEQRIALARALVVQPRILLLDEPLAALDAALRRRMQQELLAIQRQTGITFLSVTHDQDEALTMSDWMAVMNHGRIAQHGHPREIFERPANRFVAEFMGAENLLPALVTSRSGDSITVRFAGGDMSIRGSWSGACAVLVIRPNAVLLAGSEQPSWDTCVVSSSYKGTSYLTTLELTDGTSIVADIPTLLQAAPRPGDRLRVRFDTDRVTLVPGD